MRWQPTITPLSKSDSSVPRAISFSTGSIPACSIWRPHKSTDVLNYLSSRVPNYVLVDSDKIDVKYVYTEVDFIIGSQFIRHPRRLRANSRLARKQVASVILPAVTIFEHHFEAESYDFDARVGIFVFNGIEFEKYERLSSMFELSPFFSKPGPGSQTIERVEIDRRVTSKQNVCPSLVARHSSSRQQFLFKITPLCPLGRCARSASYSTTHACQTLLQTHYHKFIDFVKFALQQVNSNERAKRTCGGKLPRFQHRSNYFITVRHITPSWRCTGVDSSLLDGCVYPHVPTAPNTDSQCRLNSSRGEQCQPASWRPMIRFVKCAVGASCMFIELGSVAHTAIKALFGGVGVAAELKRRSKRENLEKTSTREHPSHPPCEIPIPKLKPVAAYCNSKNANLSDELEEEEGEGVGFGFVRDQTSRLQLRRPGFVSRRKPQVRQRSDEPTKRRLATKVPSGSEICGTENVATVKGVTDERDYRTGYHITVAGGVTCLVLSAGIDPTSRGREEDKLLHGALKTYFVAVTKLFVYTTKHLAGCSQKRRRKNTRGKSRLSAVALNTALSGLMLRGEGGGRTLLIPSLFRTRACLSLRRVARHSTLLRSGALAAVPANAFSPTTRACRCVTPTFLGDTRKSMSKAKGGGATCGERLYADHYDERKLTCHCGDVCDSGNPLDRRVASWNSSPSCHATCRARRYTRLRTPRAKHRRTEGTRETGYPREDLTSDIVRHDSHRLKYGSGPVGNRTRLASAPEQGGIVPDDAAGRRVFSGSSCFSRTWKSVTAPFSPHFTLIGSQDLVFKSLPTYLNSTQHTFGKRVYEGRDVMSEDSRRRIVGEVFVWRWSRAAKNTGDKLPGTQQGDERTCRDGGSPFSELLPENKPARSRMRRVSSQPLADVARSPVAARICSVPESAEKPAACLETPYSNIHRRVYKILRVGESGGAWDLRGLRR
ncbi:hypothetical protein PR048_013494 [Dryococelus australis]|uniref:Uncharacterized protein n=1 Tax=Dryococelus australis TaxID=614101 RepID=A0ABQ9HSC3_9NEOP|nr:hypothetical protein PR048_013494 [Dryococelus australis]